MIALSTDHAAQISETIAARLLALREDRKLTREAFVDAAHAAGGSAFTAASLRNIETGRPDTAGRRRREVSVDELVLLSASLGVSPLDLLGSHAQLFGAEPRVQVPVEPCVRCGTRGGAALSAVREDLELLGALEGVEPSLAEVAYALAEALDAGGGDDGKQLPALAKELRATLKDLRELTDARHSGNDDDEDDLGPE